MTDVEDDLVAEALPDGGLDRPAGAPSSRRAASSSRGGERPQASALVMTSVRLLNSDMTLGSARSTMLSEL